MDSQNKNVRIALLHYPVYNNKSEIVTTSITNFDIHDIARISRTYNLLQYCVITPIEKQREMALAITGHWDQRRKYKEGAEDRFQAIERVCVAESLEKWIENIQIDREKLLIFGTTADKETFLLHPGTPKYGNTWKVFRDRFLQLLLDYEILILLGTGWGISRSVLLQCDGLIPPIGASFVYNHLPVRAAAAIMLDRLLSKEMGEL